MPLTSAQLAALKTELTTDPRGYGFAADINVGNIDGVSKRLTLKRDGSTGTVPTNPTGAGGNANGTIRLNNPTVDTGAIRAAVTFAGFDGLVASAQAWFEWLTANGIITVNAYLLQQLAGLPTATGSIWAAADRLAMNAAMELLMRKFASRAEELFGLGVAPTEAEIVTALNLP